MTDDLKDMFNSLDKRVGRIEEVARSYTAEGGEREQLLRGVESLRGAVEALNDFLAAAQHANVQRIEEIEARTVPRKEVEEKTQSTLRKHRRDLGLAIVFVLITVYVAINVHEVYRDACSYDTHTRSWCGHFFFFDETFEPDGGIDENDIERNSNVIQ